MSHRPVTRYRPLLEVMGYIALLSSLVFLILFIIGFQIPFLYGDTFLKVGSIVSIGFFVLINASHKNHVLLLASLLAVSIGEVLSALRPSDTLNILRYLGYGISLGILSILFFLNRIPLKSLRSLRMNLSALTSGIMILACYWFYPKLTDQLVSYAIYSITLFLTITTAILSKFPLRLLGFGTTLIVVSEFALLATPFVRVPDYTPDLIWAMTYLGALFVTLGIILVQEQDVIRSVYREH